MNEVDRDMLKNALMHSVVKVRFTKVDGSERTMLCTLSENLIPVGDVPKTNRVYDGESATMRVFNMDLHEWRSFREDNLIDWSIVA